MNVPHTLSLTLLQRQQRLPPPPTTLSRRTSNGLNVNFRNRPLSRFARLSSLTLSLPQVDQEHEIITVLPTRYISAIPPAPQSEDSPSPTFYTDDHRHSMLVAASPTNVRLVALFSCPPRRPTTILLLRCSHLSTGDRCSLSSQSITGVQSAMYIPGGIPCPSLVFCPLPSGTDGVCI